VRLNNLNLLLSAVRPSESDQFAVNDWCMRAFRTKYCAFSPIVSNGKASAMQKAYQVLRSNNDRLPLRGHEILVPLRNIDRVGRLRCGAVLLPHLDGLVRPANSECIKHEQALNTNTVNREHTNVSACTHVQACLVEL
jgi:hypothetical protein